MLHDYFMGGFILHAVKSSMAVTILGVAISGYSVVHNSNVDSAHHGIAHTFLSAHTISSTHIHLSLWSNKIGSIIKWDE